MACSREQQEFEGGYELKMVNEDKDLECSICIHLLKEAMGTPCSHVFCRGCILKLTGRETIGGTTFTCPDCQQQVDTNKVYPNTFLDRKVGGSNVYCLQRSEGCEWIGTLNSFFQKHQSECNFQMVLCIYDGCRFSGIKLKIKDHESKCQYRIVQCEHCQPGIKANLLEVLRKDLQHMAFTRDEFTQYQSKINDLEAANKEMRDEINKLKYPPQSRVQDLQNEIRQLKSANTKLKNEVQVLRDEVSSSKNIANSRLMELLSNGIDEWIKKLETLKFVEKRKYKVWYQSIFMLMKKNELYKFDNAMFIKVKNADRRRIYWSSNNEAEQDAVSELYDHCYFSENGSILGKSKVSWVIETQTLYDFTLDNSKGYCLNRFGVGEGRTIALRQSGVFNKGYFDEKQRRNHGWFINALSNDFYLNNSVIVCLMRK